MNKIEELAKQSGWNDWTDDDNWIHPWYQERGYLTLNDLETFAELIIKECAEIADKAEPYKASDLIKKHFGFEDT